MTRSPRSRFYAQVADTLDRLVGWDRLPRLVGLFTLVELRRRLRALNLYDISRPEDRKVERKFESRYLTARTPDGTYNDLKDPWMGSAGIPFGRNVPPENTHRETDQTIRFGPNPRTVSRRLLTRNEGFKPVEGLNLLAASWLQFMVRDWLSHGEGKSDALWRLDKDPGDDWPEETVDVPRTPVSEGSGAYPTYKNTETHWWDGSQIYGSNEADQRRVRADEDGKLHVGPDGLIPVPPPPEDPVGSKHPVDKPGFWIGVYMLGTLFTLEHNAICDRLREEYPWMSHEELFERARLVNAALLAKIHTVEWTPAILGHPTLRIGMRANWWGLAGERVRKLLGRVSESEVWSGIPGSKTDHFDVPYSITEEFVAVYRMHPLIPDELSFRSAYDNTALGRGAFSFHDVMNRGALKVLDDGVGMRDLFYSFGTLHPGQIRLHNYPSTLQRFERANDGNFMDLAATDILRNRELGVPRYNEFRRLLRLPAPKTFEELTDNETWAKELREVYGGNIESVDAMIGMYAERFPKGFGFSETAFRIFILMASRRLNSDRFFTTHYTPEVYTEAGMKWIEDNDMTTVLLRHYPGLRPSMRGIENAFFPWAETGPRGPGWETAETTER